MGAAGAKPSTGIEYEWVKIDGQFKRVPKKTKASPAAPASAAAASNVASSLPAQHKKTRAPKSSNAQQSKQSSVSPTNNADQPPPRHEDTGAETLLPASQRQSCRNIISEILRTVWVQQDSVRDRTTTGEVVDLTSSREEIVSLDTAVLRLEIALYVAFPFLERDGAVAATKDSTAAGKRVSYAVASSRLQHLLRMQAVAQTAAETASSSDNADGFLAQVLSGKICAEQISPLIGDAVADATTVPHAGEGAADVEDS